VNGDGEAIGINTAFNAPGSGIGFAISINMARRVAEELIKTGRVPRGFLGVHLISLTEELAQGWGIAGTHGVVTEVPRTPRMRQIAGRMSSRFTGIRRGGWPRLLVAQSRSGSRSPSAVPAGGTPSLRGELTERADRLSWAKRSPGDSSLEPQMTGSTFRPRRLGVLIDRSGGWSASGRPARGRHRRWWADQSVPRTLSPRFMRRGARGAVVRSWRGRAFPHPQAGPVAPRAGPLARDSAPLRSIRGSPGRLGAATGVW
jgi:hypothetical protein